MRKLVYWLIYAVCIATGIYVAQSVGLDKAVFEHDPYKFNLFVTCLWAATEGRLLCGYLGILPSREAISDALWFSNLLQAAAVTSTLVGLVLAFWPFIGITDVELIRAHIGQLISGVAVALVPSAIAFVGVALIEINSAILRRAS